MGVEGSFMGTLICEYETQSHVNRLFEIVSHKSKANKV